MKKTNMPDHEPGPTEIISLFETARDKNSPKETSLLRYADALRLVGRFTESLRSYNILESMNIPVSKRALIAMYKGQLFHEMGNFTKAEMSFREACESEDSTASRIFLARTLSMQERFSEALKVLRDGLTCGGDLDEVWLGIALNQRSLGQISEAAQSLKTALELTPDYPEAKEVFEDVAAALAVMKDSPNCGQQR